MRENCCDQVLVNTVANGDKSGKFLVSFSDGSEITVNAAQIADFKLYAGQEFSDDEYKEMQYALKLSKAKSRAVNILGNRSLSADQIKKRLVAKGETEDIAQSTTDWLLELGLINDEQYARSIVSHYTSKGYGPLRIKDEMYKRGIERDLFNEILSELNDSDVNEAAEAFLEKKLKGSLEPDNLNRAKNALIRRGFSYEQVNSAIKNYLNENEEISENY